MVEDQNLKSSCIKKNETTRLYNAEINLKMNL